jgi:predicted signal transduction protein with EAL and GGDEF domain
MRCGSSSTLGASDLVRAADKALYSAKQAGRGQAKLRDIADADTPELATGITT